METYGDGYGGIGGYNDTSSSSQPQFSDAEVKKIAHDHRNDNHPCAKCHKPMNDPERKSTVCVDCKKADSDAADKAADDADKKAHPVRHALNKLISGDK
jgi:hypothetical protein